METIDLTDPDVRVRISRNRRARRYTLRLESNGDGAVLTAPPHVPLRECRAFVHRHRDWLAKALNGQPGMVTIADGAVLPVAGASVEVTAEPGRRRAPVLEGNQLILRGPGPIGPRVATWLQMRARDALQPAVTGYAAQLGRSVARVALRDTRTRWGSCSTSGTVSFSWRLAMAPPEVQAYVAAHEAAHLVEMNHSPAYWAVVDHLMPDWKPHRAWLRSHGRDLHRYRFDGG